MKLMKISSLIVLSLIAIFSTATLGILAKSGTNVTAVIEEGEVTVINSVVEGLGVMPVTISLESGVSHVVVVDSDGKRTLLTPNKVFGSPHEYENKHSSMLLQKITGSSNAYAGHCSDGHLQCSGTYIDNRGFSRPDCWCL